MTTNPAQAVREALRKKLQKAADDLEAYHFHHANHEDSDCEPHCSAQIEFEEWRETVLEALAALTPSPEQGTLVEALRVDEAIEECAKVIEMWRAKDLPLNAALPEAVRALKVLPLNDPVPRPDWNSIYADSCHESDRDGELVSVTRETLRIGRMAVQRLNAEDYYHNSGAAYREMAVVLGDYDKEKR